MLQLLLLFLVWDRHNAQRLSHRHAPKFTPGTRAPQRLYHMKVPAYSTSVAIARPCRSGPADVASAPAPPLPDLVSNLHARATLNANALGDAVIPAGRLTLLVPARPGKLIESIYIAITHP